MREPVLVSGTDGVGTKLKLAQLLGPPRHRRASTSWRCARTTSSSPAPSRCSSSTTSPSASSTAEKVAAIVAGIAEGCRQAGCALLGGEMAEHPGVMEPDDYDLSGFCVGVVDRPRHDRRHATSRAGDVVLGLASSGLHCNGFSLVRSVLVEGREAELELPRVDLGGETLGEALLTPTRIYVAQHPRAARAACRVKGMAHITGGGITENLDRVLPEGLRRARRARLVAGAARLRPRWPRPAASPRTRCTARSTWASASASSCSPEDAAEAAALLREQGETVYEIGEIVAGNREVVYA